MLTIIALFGVLLAALPTATVVAVGLLPTVVALIVDLTPGRYLMRCVAGLNISGIAPFLQQLWAGENNMSAALSIVADPFVWLAIYGASAIGWLLFLGVPGAVAITQSLNIERRVNALKQEQKDLLNEWGDSIRPKGELASSGKQAEGADTDAAEPAAGGAPA